jgi:hypothetical protein
MDAIIQLIQNNPWWGVVASAIALASAIAAATPTPKKGTLWARVYGLVDWLALNVGKAKDKGE